MEPESPYQRPKRRVTITKEVLLELLWILAALTILTLQAIFDPSSMNAFNVIDRSVSS
ncbi:hypothetical protein [Mesobacillus foraminis]|uniref:hypothetical protein n=1 Tax=Mesobacillus foraminis TaxID=279826 RepID=UPI0013CEBFC0|nr:hypothetical protein [Mesobacillus foraminis]